MIALYVISCIVFTEMCVRIVGNIKRRLRYRRLEEYWKDHGTVGRYNRVGKRWKKVV